MKAVLTTMDYGVENGVIKQKEVINASSLVLMQNWKESVIVPL